MKREEGCSKRGMIKDGRFYDTMRCTRRGVVERDGKLWCRQHDPEAEKARRAASERAWRAKWDAACAARDREQRIADARAAVIAAARESVRDDIVTVGLARAVRALEAAEAAEPDR